MASFFCHSLVERSKFGLNELLDSSSGLLAHYFFR